MLRSFSPRTLILHALVVGLAAGAAACDTDDRQDQWLGTDAAAGYAGPEAGFAEAGATQRADADGGQDDAADAALVSNLGPVAKDTKQAADGNLVLAPSGLHLPPLQF